MAGRLQDKVCIITGAASGIGRACTERFNAEGAHLVLCDVDADAVTFMTGEIEDAGGSAMASAGDVTDQTYTVEAVGAAAERFGRVDVLVNSAGITARTMPEEMGFEAIWDRVMAVNVKGTMLMSRAAATAMREGGGGSIVNLASIMGLVGYPPHFGFSDGFSPYPHSKGAVIQLTRDMATGLAKDQIRSNAVCPGFIYTPLTETITSANETHSMLVDMHPLGRLGQPAEVANVILFLASDEASFVTGATYTVDGGYTAA